MIMKSNSFAISRLGLYLFWIKIEINFILDIYFFLEQICLINNNYNNNINNNNDNNNDYKLSLCKFELLFNVWLSIFSN